MTKRASSEVIMFFIICLFILFIDSYLFCIDMLQDKSNNTELLTELINNQECKNISNKEYSCMTEKQLYKALEKNSNCFTISGLNYICPSE